MEDYHVTIYCTGCKYCVEEHPETFKMNGTGKAFVHNTSALTEDEVEAIMGLCPVMAIVWGPVAQQEEAIDLKSMKV